jgi:amidophosphoribosyltransferase
VPVPDTAKAAADSMAYELGVPSVEGIIRNRYIGRTFIEGQQRADRVRMKYTPLREVLEGKRVLLIEDTIVRSTTLQSLLHLVRDQGRAREIHVRVACPPIVAPCFYGIDMSTMGELFAPKYMEGETITLEEQEAMARHFFSHRIRRSGCPSRSRLSIKVRVRWIRATKISTSNNPKPLQHSSPRPMRVMSFDAAPAGAVSLLQTTSPVIALIKTNRMKIA